MTVLRRVAAVAIALLLAGCKDVGPNYQRPPTNLPSTYRGAAASGAQSFGDEKWTEVFRDPVLQSLIAEALVANFDVRVAVQHVLEARAQLAAVAADQLPSVGASLEGNYQRSPSTVPTSSYATWSKIFGGQLSYEADIWGRLARSTQSAQAQLLASEAAREAVLTTVVSSVAQGYLVLRELDLELQITRETLAARQDSLRLTELRLEGGITTLQDVRQAESLVDTVLAAIPVIQQQIAQTENAISLLLGRNPGPIPRGLSLLEMLDLPPAPPGVPGSLLERRPDVREAEDFLVAANAQVGAAEGLLLPSVQITASAALVNTLVAGLALPVLNGPYGTLGIFSIVGAASQVIFDGGKLRANVAYAKAAKDEAIAVYQRTIVNGVREVSDGLAGYDYGIQTVRQEQALVAALDDSVRLANLRYAAGVTSYLEVLNAQTQDYSAQIDLARAELSERTAIVTLYKALGGGWQ